MTPDSKENSTDRMDASDNPHHEENDTGISKSKSPASKKWDQFKTSFWMIFITPGRRPLMVINRAATARAAARFFSIPYSPRRARQQE
jgi:hypothetical protein